MVFVGCKTMMYNKDFDDVSDDKKKSRVHCNIGASSRVKYFATVMSEHL